MEERGIFPWLSVFEPVSFLSHLAGAIAVALLASRLFVRVGREPRRRRAAWLYLLGVGGMFAVSATYHYLPNSSPYRELAWRFDHAMIWWTIAGTISAVQVLAGLALGWRVFVVWGIALTGMVVEQLTLNGMSMWVSPVLYVSMGWYGIFPMVRLVREHGLRFSRFLIAAGVTSTLGGVCDALEWPSVWPGVIEAHEVMHVLIACGMWLFYKAVDGCAGLPIKPYAHSADAAEPAGDST